MFAAYIGVCHRLSAIFPKTVILTNSLNKFVITKFRINACAEVAQMMLSCTYQNRPW